MRAFLIRRRALLLQLLALAVIVGGVVACYHNPTIHPDEAFHLIAGRSINAGEGLPEFGGDVYDRAWLFSYIVAAATRLGGDRLEVARLPAMISVVLLAMVLWWWVRRVADTVAAWVAAVLLGTSIFTIDAAHFCRFYSLHALVTLVMSLCVYEASVPGLDRSLRRRWSCGALLSGVLAIHLQLITAIAISACAGWLALGVAEARLRSARYRPTAKLSWLAGGAALLAIMALGIVHFDLWHWAMTTFGWMPVWADPDNGVAGYHHHLLRWYPLMWVLMPTAMLAAGAVYGRPGWFVAWCFAVSFVAVSLFSGFASRYLLFAMPMFCAVWGMVGSSALRTVHAKLTVAMGGPAAQTAWSRKALALASASAVALAGLYCLHHTPAYFATRRMLMHPHTAPLIRYGDYAAVLEALRAGEPTALAMRTIIAAPSAKALYYFPHANVRRIGSVTHGDSARRPLCTVDELRQFMDGALEGLIVIDGGYWRKDHFVTDALADHIEAHARRLSIPPEAGVHVFRFDPATLAMQR